MTSPENAVGHHDPSEWFNADGSFNHRKTNAVSNTRITAEECATLRRSLRGCADTTELDTDLSQSAIGKHVKGNCECPVDVPTLRYHRNRRRWVRADGKELEGWEDE